MTHQQEMPHKFHKNFTWPINIPLFCFLKLMESPYVDSNCKIVPYDLTKGIWKVLGKILPLVESGRL